MAILSQVTVRFCAHAHVHIAMHNVMYRLCTCICAVYGYRHWLTDGRIIAGPWNLLIFEILYSNY